MTTSHDPSGTSRRPLVVGFIITMIACLIGSAAVYALLQGGRHHVRARPNDARWYMRVPREVNEVESATFDQRTDAERDDAEARRRLERYGWVARDRQIVHVPIRVAIQHYLDQQGAKP